MTSSYLDIYKKFLGLIESYDFLQMSDTEAYEQMSEWLQAVIARPKVRKLFSSIIVNKEIMQISYTLLSPIDEANDKETIESLLANGMVLEWLSPRLNTDSSIMQMFGTKEQKFYSQANHMPEVREICKNAREVLDKDYIRDRGYAAFVLNGHD